MGLCEVNEVLGDAVERLTEASGGKGGTLVLKLKKHGARGKTNWYKVVKGKKVYAKVDGPMGKDTDSPGEFLVNIAGVGTYRRTLDAALQFVEKSIQSRLNMTGGSVRVEIK